MAQRIYRLRMAKGWSRAELGRRMAKAIERDTPFSGELIRLYELDENEKAGVRPGNDARRALALVFERTEPYIEFGTLARSTQAREEEADYRTLSEAALEVARAFDALQPHAQLQIREQIDVLRAAERGGYKPRTASHELRRVSDRDAAPPARGRRRKR